VGSSSTEPASAARRAGLAGTLLAGLRAARLLGPAFRAYERWQTWTSARRRGGAAAGPDGLPLPPQRLVVLVAGPASVESFLRKGRLGADVVRDALARQGVAIATVGDVLDFGVGCGRVARHWHDLTGPRIHGCDINEELVAWTRANLPFVEARVTGLGPPLPYADGALDVAYALSVFTHLPEELQGAWAAELARVIRPGGHLVLSTHGRAYFDRLDAGERADFEADRLIVHYAELAGANLCSVFHSTAAVARQFSDGFELVESVPEGARGNGRQDLHVLRRYGQSA
jgi:SAM-dependent methyltransferase